MNLSDFKDEIYNFFKNLTDEEFLKKLKEAGLKENTDSKQVILRITEDNCEGFDYWIDRYVKYRSKGKEELNDE